MAGRVHTFVEDGIGWMVFAHPERRNAITLEMWRAIPPAIERLRSDADVRVIVLRGEGDEFFVSGADISEFEQTRFGPALADYQQANDAAFEAIAATQVPTLAMIHGHCLGGGLALALSADIRYCDQVATFTIPAARLGIGYSKSGIDQLQRVVGPAIAKEILFTAELVDAARALRWGLVNEVVPSTELHTHVVRVARRIAANAPLSQRAAKLAVDGASTGDVERAVEMCAASEDYKEGVRAFLEKRPAQFTGR